LPPDIYFAAFYTYSVSFVPMLEIQMSSTRRRGYLKGRITVSIDGFINQSGIIDVDNC